jgi:hypothetical protein
MAAEHDVEPIASAVVDELALTQLGYAVEIEKAGSHITITLGHPLLLDSTVGVSIDYTSESWPEELRDLLDGHPDVRITRGSAVVRPEAVRLVAILRNAARVAWLRKPISEDKIDVAMNTISSAALAVKAAGWLTEEEVDWLMMALDGDQETFAGRRATS